MNNIVTKMTYKEYRILSHSWRILSAILIAFILISCTTPRSPRGSYGETSIRKPIKQVIKNKIQKTEMPTELIPNKINSQL